ncbi:MAG: CoA pyrophosphatase [Flavobacteriales bacterium]|nr:CoA pyrophosphatase [Flavobacteriales bacterium]
MKIEKERIIDALNGELPGIKAHDEVLGYERPTVDEVLSSEIDPRLSSVVFLIYPREDRWHFLLLKRNDYKGVHSGQVGLPGGSLEEGETEEDALIRELEEETGYLLSSNDIINKLTPLYIPPSNFIVNPFAAVIDECPEWVFDKREVNRGIEASLVDLLHPEILEEQNVFIRGGNVRLNVKSFPFGGEVVWGATAMILSECKQILAKLRI